MLAFLKKIMTRSLFCLLTITLLSSPAHPQGGESLLQREIKPWIDKLDSRQQSAFLKFFNDLASVQPKGNFDIAALTTDWNRVMIASSGTEASLTKIEAWCHIAMVAFKELMDKVGYIQATTLAKLIFLDGFTVLQSVPHDNYEAWAELYRMKYDEIQQYTNVYGVDIRAMDMSNTLEGWGKKYSQYSAQFQNELSGGICPTFIQPPPGGFPHRPVPGIISQTLSAAIVIPSDNCLLRADIPIYGIAGGTNFKRYLLEYGPGNNPNEWHLIEESQVPQNHFSITQVPSLMQGDLDLRGNLATWNVGLKNWEHLPWHPASDTTDLNGVYTIRLTTFGRDGERAEDRVTCEVGRVIAQCLPGIVVSSDKKVTLHFPEQSLKAAFRVFSIRPINSELPVLPSNQKLIGEVYQIKESGESFIKPVTLEMSYALNVAENGYSSTFGIFTFNAERNIWVLLNTMRDEDQKVLRTDLTALPSPKAYFAIFSSRDSLIQSSRDNLSSEHIRGRGTVRRPVSDKIFIRDDFERDLGEWSDRDAGVGASVSRVCTGDKKANCYVKVSNKTSEGNFACNVVTTPFDARNYPLISFDYKVEKDVHLDFFVRVANRWYDIGFTGDVNEYRNKDVNIAPLGLIPGIVSDGVWRHADFDLVDLLRRRTQNTLVEAVTLADWRVGGYMDLEFGNNAKDATVFFDNFTVAKDTTPKIKPIASGDSIIVEDFEKTTGLNSLGGAHTVFTKPGTNNCSMQIIDRGPEDAIKNRNHCLLLTYKVRQQGDYCGWMTSLQGKNLEGCTYLNFEIFLRDFQPKCLIGLKNSQEQEVKVPLTPYLGTPDKEGWRQVAIPMVVFSSMNDFASMEKLSISFEEKLGSGSGSILVDNIRFDNRDVDAIVLEINDFRDSIPNMNALGLSNWIFTNGAAAIQAKMQKISGFIPGDYSMRISFGGSIGLDLGEAGFSYAGWSTGLGGIDISMFDSLRFYVRGQKGGEVFNIYFDDGDRRRPVSVTKFGTVSKTGNNISIPLNEYIRQGVDLTHITELQFVFEWNETSGTIWADNIALIKNKKVFPISIRSSGDNR